jgi:hypothetical protein
MDAQLREQPATDEGANNSDGEIGNEAETGATHDLSCEPAGDDTDQQNDEKTFPRHDVLPEASARLASAEMLHDPNCRRNSTCEQI